jgi:2-enoate reductase
MQVNLGKLFESVKIGPVEIKNRVAMAPMGVVGLVNADGSLNARGIDYYIERARGGVGLIITGVHKVESELEFIAGAAVISWACVAPFSGTGTLVQMQLILGKGTPLNISIDIEKPRINRDAGAK